MKYLIIPFFIYCFSVKAQPADIQAKAAYLSAQDAYGNGDYALAIEKLEHVKNLLGSTNPRVEHLLANAYYSTQQYGLAKTALTKYFELSADSDANYMSMLRLYSDNEAAYKEEIELEAKRAKMVLYKPVIPDGYRVKYQSVIDTEGSILTKLDQFTFYTHPKGYKVVKELVDRKNEMEVKPGKKQDATTKYIQMWIGVSYEFYLSTSYEITIAPSAELVKNRLISEVDDKFKIVEVGTEGRKNIKTEIEATMRPDVLASAQQAYFIQVPEYIEVELVWVKMYDQTGKVGMEYQITGITDHTIELKCELINDPNWVRTGTVVLDRKTGMLLSSMVNSQVRGRSYSTIESIKRLD